MIGIWVLEKQNIIGFVSTDEVNSFQLGVKVEFMYLAGRELFFLSYVDPVNMDIGTLGMLI